MISLRLKQPLRASLAVSMVRTIAKNSKNGAQWCALGHWSFERRTQTEKIDPHRLVS